MKQMKLGSSTFRSQSTSKKDASRISINNNRAAMSQHLQTVDTIHKPETPTQGLREKLDKLSS